MRIAILTPYHGDVRAEYAFSLAHLTQHVQRTRPGWTVKLWMQSSSSLVKLRTQLATDALAWGADWMLWLDSDHLFPPTTLERLLAPGHDVIGANYRRRDSPYLPVAATQTAPIDTTAEKAARQLIEPAAALGAGVLLTRASIFRRIPRPWFAIVEDGAGGFISEDGYFMLKLAGAGIVPHIDHALSWEVGHIGMQTVSFQS
ncbi:MAG: hypothetical protein RQ833_01200 [Sphingomonadaceae bacterium]|nr:hypothetical protein [Sphingomonadaceae bacterium]